MNRSIPILFALAAAAIAPCSAQNLSQKSLSSSISTAQSQSALVSQDPLMRQIRHRQLTQSNGGVTAAVRIASGQSIELRVVELDLHGLDLKDAVHSTGQTSQDPTRRLTPLPGLAQTGTSTADKRRTIKAAADQLEALAKQGRKQTWGETGKTASRQAR